MSLPAIAIAQINVTVGDIAGNAKKILAAYDNAVVQGAELVVFPELCLIGYPPEDLVLMPGFRERAMTGLRELAKHTQSKAAMIVGSVWDNRFVTSGEDESVYNAAVLMDEGRILHVQPKTTLPNYGVFDEKRLFVPESPEPVEWRGHMLGLMVCEDIWNQEVAQQHKQLGADVIIVINASPFEAGKLQLRRKVVCEAVKESGLPVVYAALVGGQDDIVFDGGSFAVDHGCTVTTQFPQFREHVALIRSVGDTALMPLEETLWEAMKLGLRDYVEKNNFPGVLLGLSGGIDSAVTAAVAVDALGKARVRGVLLPSPYTSKESTEDALELANYLGIETVTVPITPGMQVMKEVLSPMFHDAAWMENISIGGNLQARLRGITLMALSNQSGFMLLSTGNKSEIAVGYTTLYGDSCGGYNVLKDLYKTQIYTLANWRNAQGRVIPERSITKAPSAELKPGQTDQDQLPPYEVLDVILALHIEGRLAETEIIAREFDPATVRQIVRLVRLSEYKRRQSCPGVKLSPMLFGKDRRYPLTNGFKP